MWTKIKFRDAMKIAVFSAFSSMLVFFMIEVLWAQVMKDTVIQMYEDDDFLLTFLIISGFLLSIVTSIIAALLSSERVVKQHAAKAALVAFVSNLGFWILISYYEILTRYPEVLSNLNLFEKIIAAPQVIAYYSVYVLSNVTVLWLVCQVTYAVLFAGFLVLFGARKSGTQYAYSNYSL